MNSNNMNYNKENNGGLDDTGTNAPEAPQQNSRKHHDKKKTEKPKGKTTVKSFTIGTIVCFLALCIFGGLFVYLEYSKHEADRIIDYNVTTEGTVTKTWTQRSSSYKSNRTYYYASYNYKYKDGTYNGTEKMNDDLLREGQTVTVYVDPEKPSDSRLFREFPLTPYVALLGFAPFGIYWVIDLQMFLSGRKSRKKKKQLNT